MKLAVIGAGVIGVTTAYELSCDGHEVTVFERTSTAAEGASFANMGLLAPAWMAARASAQWLQDRPAGLASWWRGLRRASPAMPSRTDPGNALLALADSGAQRLDELCASLQLSVDSHQGMMVVWREARDSKRAEDLHTRIRACGAECHLMPAEQARALESALNAETPLQGALVMADAWSVNCRQFTVLLRAAAQRRGCRFEFGRTVSSIQAGARHRILCDGDVPFPEHFDGVVLCAGSGSDGLLASLGVRLPLAEWEGHSLSAAVREPLDAPVAVVHDLQHQVSIARMGQRIRVSGPAVRAGRTAGGNTPFKALYAVLDDWFPGAIRRGSGAGVQEWAARITSTTDGLPVIGQTARPGIWVNTGHGMHGWVTACSSARLLADMVAGQDSAFDPAPYSTSRFAGHAE